MAGEKHTNSSPKEQIRDESSSKESPQADRKTAAWFQRLMRISIWEKGNTESKKEAAGKGLPGHRDPTADAAIANVMREEKRKGKGESRKGGEENA